ncbi:MULTISPECIES: CidA/LrgA family protein [Mediterranea]|uniref:CidA/LrgA family protein n=2 Tax=Bacteroidaceae TaxID=815 RepID=UPI002011C8AD|nr:MULTISPECIES: CidA/LrgA family protein [Mediterranea]MCL1606226.1 CidA/LrgA family protein [Mediterranea sp. ET5]MDM8121268.1 CidA/LrgA family protein [Mediterranea massiliensis]MDM8198026.1 CidA/LrgA family protein [Mediterranea massiliensis]
MIRQCFILFGCLALGELIVYLTGIKLPSSIIGMLLLTLFLKLKWVKLHWVQGLSDFLVANLGFFFVPPGVALMLYFDVIKAEFIPIVVSTVISTILVLVSTGWVHQYIRRHARFSKYENSSNRSKAQDDGLSK